MRCAGNANRTHLYQVDFIVQSPDRGQPVISKMTVLYLQPPLAGGQPRRGNGRKMKLKDKSRRGAFTLIEIMVAFAIFGMIVAAIYSTWVLILKSSRVGQETAAQIQRERITVRTIEDSLTCIQSFQASMKYY